jgi:hypothetical protein
MTDDAPETQAQSLLREFDLGPLPDLDLDELIRRGHRARRIRTVDRLAAVVAIVAVVCGGAVVVTRQLEQHRASPPVTHLGPTPTTTASPTTAAEREATAKAAILTAVSVHVHFVFDIFTTLDVVVTQTGAVGTLTHSGKSSPYLGVNDALYVKGDALVGFLLQDAQFTAANGRWMLMTNYAPLNSYRNLKALAQSLSTPYGTRPPTLGHTQNIQGTATIGLVNTAGATMYVAISAPYVPYLVTNQNGTPVETLSNWNATAPPIAAAPAPTQVYDPAQN